MITTRTQAVAAWSLLCLLGASAAGAVPRYDPRLRFRVIRTAHFAIYYHQREEAMAKRLALVAEDVRGELAARLGLVPPGKTHVVLVDQTDVANGWSTPVPCDTIEIAATWPAPSSFLGHHDDWLRIAFIHEYTHILHLDRVGGWMRGVRWLFGRHPASFPNLYVPEWQIEGIATWAESALTGVGRVHGADVAATRDQISRDRGPLPIDQAGGGLVAWPSGHVTYFYGARVYDTLARRAGPSALGALTEATARRVPFFGGGAFPLVVGTDVLDVWRDAQQAPPGPPAGRAATTPAAPRRLTTDGFVVAGPRFVVPASQAPGRRGASVFYSARGPHRFPDIRRIGLDGGASTGVTTRFLGDTVSSDGQWVYFDQLEYDGPVAQYSDLYAVSLDSHHVIRLSRRERLGDADVDRAGRRIAAIRARLGEKALVVWGLRRDADGAPSLLPSPALVVAESGCQFATPRWSPDGTRLVAIRHCPGSLPSVVLVNAQSGAVTPLGTDARSRNLTPAWTPDSRAVLYASDRVDRRFKLYRLRLNDSGLEAAGPPELVVDAPGGASWPDVSPDGTTVAFVSLSGEGYDVYTAPLPSGPVAPPAPLSESTADAGARRGATPAASHPGESGAAPASAAYSPLPTLAPRSWTPVLRLGGDSLDVGASTAGADVLGYHAYSASAWWTLSRDEPALAQSAATPDWLVTYLYSRWRLAPFLTASSVTDTVSTGSDPAAPTATADEQTREVFAGALLPWRRVRVRQDWLAGAVLSERRLPAPAAAPVQRRHAIRAGWAVNSAHEYGYSISPERGARVAATIERVSAVQGADGCATSATIDGRVYLPGGREHHVVALRTAIGASAGDTALLREFSLGGAAAPAAPFTFGRHALGLVRGLDRDAADGPALAVANLDYRFPILRVERGYRTWPLFLRMLHGAVFADAGSTGPSLQALGPSAWSAGAELSADLTLGYNWNLPLTLGVARTHDPGRSAAQDRAAVYLRTGYAF